MPATIDVQADRVLLTDVQALVLSKLDPKLLDEDGSWIYLPLLRLWQAQLAQWHFSEKDWGRIAPTERFERKLLARAQEFLAPLAKNPGCRVVSSRNRWRNTGYSPPSPIGNYLWPHAVRHVQEVIWMRPEFVDGYDFWLDHREPYRDANPYGGRPDQLASWDAGYLVGHSEHHHPGQIRRWMESLS